MPLDEFKETSNGYLFGDTCVLGAEVYVTGSSVAERQILSFMKKTTTNKFTWTIENFSTSKDERLESKKFIIQDLQWTLRLYPDGDAGHKGKGILVFLGVADDELKKHTEKWKVNADFKLRIRNQLNANHVEKGGTQIFCDSTTHWGYINFMALSDAKDESNGFVRNDNLVVEGEITKLEVIKTLKTVH